MSAATLLDYFLVAEELGLDADVQRPLVQLLIEAEVRARGFLSVALAARLIDGGRP